jgi:hypothetical protein
MKRHITKMKRSFLDIYCGPERHHILSDDVLYLILEMSGVCGSNFFVLYEPRNRMRGRKRKVN